MKCIIANDVLLKHLQSISGVVSSSSSLPILETFLFELEQNVLYITASDMETSIRVSLPVSITDKPGKIAIPAKLLIETLKTFPSIPISISVTKTDTPPEISISAGEGTYKFTGYDPEDFPKHIQVTSSQKVSIEGDVIANAISKTIFATINDMLRPAMTGIYWDFRENQANFVSTDAHRLVRYRKNNINIEQPFSFILPKKSSNILKNILSSHNNPTVTLEFNNTNASFSFDNFHIICRLIDHKYPNYEAVIPSNNPNKLIISRADFITSLKRAILYSNQTTYLVKFSLKGQTMTLKAEDIDFANMAEEKIACTYDGEDIEIGFNAKFIIEMLQHINDESVTFTFSDPRRAALIQPTQPENDNEDLLMLLMPVMTSQA